MQPEGPIAIVARELPTLGPRVEYVSSSAALVRLETTEAGYQVTIAALVERSAGLAWYVVKRSETIESAEQAASAYTASACWAERVSAAAITRHALLAPEEVLI